MYSPSSVSQKFAIWSDFYYEGGSDFPEGAELNFVMYDWDWALKQAEIFFGYSDDANGYDIAGFITDENENGLSPVAAVMRVRTPGPDLYGNCNGAWEVVRSAAEGGYGPTLYDMVMSISPNGLTSDRNSVSGEAQNVWSFYANKRSMIDKMFLDPNEYTYTEEDDCLAHGNQNSSSLHTLTRIMAVEYFRDTWPYEYETMEEQIDMDMLMDWGTMPGDSYFEKVKQWIDDHAEEFELEEWDPDEASDMWFHWKMEFENNLIDYKEGEFEHPEFLNLSYNTDYASGTYEEMVGNHYDFLNELREEYGDEVYEAFEEIRFEYVTDAVNHYFKDKYQ